MSCISRCGRCCWARGRISSRASIGARLATTAASTSPASAPRIWCCGGGSDAGLAHALHTAYELDRIAGRYQELAQERAATRTIYLLRDERPVELFRLRQRYAFLAPLYDAEYGSATFVEVKQPTELEVRVSTSGLLLREAAK